MWGYLFSDIVHNKFTITVVIVSLIISIIVILYAKNTNNIKRKLTLMYCHIFFLFFPLIFSSLMWSCQRTILNCLQKSILWILSISILCTFVFGFFVLPYIYRVINKAKQIKDKRIVNFIRRYSKRLKIKRQPDVVFVDTAKPLAYSFTNFIPTIFISVGIFEMLKPKELEAILLHELYHIKTRSSFLKFSSRFTKFISPIARFSVIKNELEEEEKNADNFAVTSQKTNRHISLAKKKILYFYDNL